MVVMVHGGPYGVMDRWGFNDDAQLFASRGYAVLQVNFRGSGGYGKAFEDAGTREWGGKMQFDVTDGTRWAIETGDRKSVGKGQGVSVRLDFGGRRIMKKKKK